MVEGSQEDQFRLPAISLYTYCSTGACSTDWISASSQLTESLHLAVAADVDGRRRVFVSPTRPDVGCGHDTSFNARGPMSAARVYHLSVHSVVRAASSVVTRFVSAEASTYILPVRVSLTTD